MGLDMRPLGKPKVGFENRFKQILRIVQKKETQELSFFDKIKGKKKLSEAELLKEWFENQIESYITIKAPRVGYDEIANDWINEKYQETEKEITQEEFINQHNGFYVIELSEEKDAVPVYIAMGQDENVFRGQFLTDCVDIIGEELVGEAWETKFADETLDYGNRLMDIGLKIAKENNLEYLKDQRNPPDSDEESIESKLHIIFSLAKWLIFYGKNGHGYEADF
jgi:hypothetical protein